MFSRSINLITLFSALSISSSFAGDSEPSPKEAEQIVRHAFLMRWLESDIGLTAYFFPPGPEDDSGDGGLWKFLSPLIPLVLYRVVDQVLD